MSNLPTSPDVKPCLDFARIMIIIRKRLDGRDVATVGDLMGKSRSTLGRVESGETLPEKVTEKFIETFLEEVERHLIEFGLFKKRKGRFKQLTYCLYRAYDCIQQRAIEMKREQRKYQ